MTTSSSSPDLSAMVTTKSLNPQAPEYVPLSTATTLSTLHLNLPRMLPITPSLILPAFPTSPLPFPYPNEPPLHVPAYLTLIQRESFDTQTVTSLPQYFTNFLSFSASPPPQADAPASPTPVSPLVVTSEAAVSVSLPLQREVITEKIHVPKPPVLRAGIGRGRGGFGRGACLPADGSGRKREWFTRGSSSMHEEKRASRGSTSVTKYRTVALRRDEDKTTVMIKNIPYEYTPRMLVEFMDMHCMSENQNAKQGRCAIAEQKPLSAYDFLYLPMDFRTKLNKGYAFVNFTEPEAVWKFFHAWDRTKWDFGESTKIKRIVCARIQGKEALVTHFQKSNFECESDEFLPACFSPPRDGSGDTVKLTVVGNRSRKSHGSYHQPMTHYIG